MSEIVSEQPSLFGDTRSRAMMNPNFKKSKLELRPYQHEAIDTSVDMFEKGDASRLLVVLPTGAGKTIVASDLVRRMAKHGRVLFLAHREELIFQTKKKMEMVLGANADIGIVKAELNECRSDIVVASIQTVMNPKRLQQLGDFGLVICDEAHHSTSDSWMSTLRSLGCFEEDGPFVFGMTATPDRADGVGLKAVYEKIAYEVGIFDMIDQGYLVDIEAKTIDIDVDISSIKVTRGDFSARDSGRVLMESHAPEIIAQAIVDHTDGRQTVVFVPTVEMAEETAKEIRDRGIVAEAVSAKTHVDQRRAIMQNLNSKKLQVVVNVGILTEGTDIPSLECAVMARPTKSRGLFTQMVGRILRPAMNKEKALVLDLVGNSQQHRVQTVATLFGLNPKKVKESDKTVTEMLAEQEAEKQAELNIKNKFSGRVFVKETVDMRRQAVHWVVTSEGQYVTRMGADLILLRFSGIRNGTPEWDVWKVPERGRPMRLHENMMLEFARGAVEDMMRKAGAMGKPLNDSNAPWRKDPVSPNQLAMCRSRGIPTSRLLTKGDASDALTANDAMKRLWSVEMKRSWEK